MTDQALHDHAIKVLALYCRHLPERTNDVFRSLDEEERLGIHQWLVGVLRRPPLAEPAPAWRPLVALIDALAWDLALHTPDPLSPTFEFRGERWVIPVDHPRIKRQLAGIERVGGQDVVVDGMGLEVPAGGA